MANEVSGPPAAGEKEGAGDGTKWFSSFVTEAALATYAIYVGHSIVFAYCAREAEMFGIPRYLVTPTIGDYCSVILFNIAPVILLFMISLGALLFVAQGIIAWKHGWEKRGGPPFRGLVPAALIISIYVWYMLLGVLATTFLITLFTVALLTSLGMALSWYLPVGKHRFATWTRGWFWEDSELHQATLTPAVIAAVTLTLVAISSIPVGSAIADIFAPLEARAAWESGAQKYVVILRSGDNLVSVPFENAQQGTNGGFLVTPLASQPDQQKFVLVNLGRRPLRDCPFVWITPQLRQLASTPTPE